MWGGAIRFTTAMMFAIAFLIEFTMGGLSGVIFAVAPIDWQLTDTYFLVRTFTTCYSGTQCSLFFQASITGFQNSRAECYRSGSAQGIFGSPSSVSMPHSLFNTCLAHGECRGGCGKPEWSAI
jgi:heme/copper-type cytochrome/quinol oxidase subunit 1